MAENHFAGAFGLDKRAVSFIRFGMEADIADMPGRRSVYCPENKFIFHA